ncbi:MAG: ABC transporter permease [Acidimicrobiales bacterium]
MPTLFLRRLLVSIPLLAVVSLLVFSLILLVPGDPAIALAGENPSPAQIAAVRQRLGLNDPFFVQFWHWLSGVLHGDLGTSLLSSQTVASSITARLPATLSLALLALVLAAVAGLLVGAIAGLRPGTWIDRVATLGASFGVAVPYFWVGMILVLVFAIDRHLLPAVGYIPLTHDPVQWFRHLILPASALALAPAAVVARQTRASLATVMSEDYVRTARAKGLAPWVIVGKHALKNAALPVITTFGLEANRLIGGTVVIEQLFALPGIGQLAFQSVFNRDFPVVQGVVLVAAAMVLLVNIIVDVSYRYFNPKIAK